VVLGASVSGAAALSWQLGANSPGSLSATSGASANYLPPARGVSRRFATFARHPAAHVERKLTRLRSVAKFDLTL
jgi:hypothetical protein